MHRARLPIGIAAILLLATATTHAQWPALYFRADPFLRLDLSRPHGVNGLAASVFSYSAESYFDGRDQTPHTSKADAASVRFQREECVFSGQIGLTPRIAAVGAVPVSYVKQRLFESGDWGVEKVWFGITYATDHSRRFTIVVAGALPVDGAVGELHFPVAAHDNSGLVTSQFVLSLPSSTSGPGIYLRAGMGVYTSKEEYYGRRLYEFPGELRLTMPVAGFLDAGVGSEGRFVVGAPDNRLFSHTLSSHDAFAFGPDLIVRLTPEARLHATFRQEVFGFYATAGSYWSIAMILNSPQRPGR